MGQDWILTSCPGTGQAGTGFSQVVPSRPWKERGQKEKRGKNVKKSEKKRMFLPIFPFFDIFFDNKVVILVPGRPGTQEFVPGFLILPLSWDKGTAGH